MSTIFVNTDNTDPANKIFNGALAKGAATKAEAMMKKIVEGLISKAPGFTITPSEDAKGYWIRLKIAKCQVVGPDTVTKISGQIVRFPKEIAQQGNTKGEVMVSLGDWSAEATASGKNDYAILDGVQACVEKMIPKSLNPMKTDFLKR
jgi:hypothetical protein